MSNPEWFGSDGRATFDREQLHKKLQADFEAEATEVPQNRQAVIITGPPGSGKSNVRDDILKDTGTMPEQWRHIDPDAFRDRLSGAMHRDGTLNQLVPPEAAGAAGWARAGECSGREPRAGAAAGAHAAAAASRSSGRAGALRQWTSNIDAVKPVQEPDPGEPRNHR